MTKIKTGIIFGVIAGLIDVTPMILMKLPWDADLSAFSMWLIIGFFIATSNLKINAVLKGIIISFFVLLPPAIIIGRQNPMDLIVVFSMTFILGSSLGYCIGRFTKE
jgi:hypothetical protein